MSNKSRHINSSDRGLLWLFSGGRCGFPDCNELVFEDATEEDPAVTIGEIAHIVDHSTRVKSPRNDPDFPPERRNKYENLIILCPNCHTKVDKQNNSYTVEDLRKWKSEHQERVMQEIKDNIPQVGFAELEIICKAISENVTSVEESLELPLEPKEKIKKNGLSEQVRFVLTMGLSKAREVGQFIAQMVELDANFPDRLRSHFINEYNSLVAKGFKGDALFFELKKFACRGLSNPAHEAAGLAVLAYLFEKCDIFER